MLQLLTSGWNWQSTSDLSHSSSIFIPATDPRCWWQVHLVQGQLPPTCSPSSLGGHQFHPEAALTWYSGQSVHLALGLIRVVDMVGRKSVLCSTWDLQIPPSSSLAVDQEDEKISPTSCLWISEPPFHICPLFPWVKQTHTQISFTFNNTPPPLCLEGSQTRLP